MIFADLIPWYLSIQLCALAALPLALRFFHALPDRGYAFAKVLGIFLVGLVLWLGANYGLLRNDFGGAWLALGVVAALSYAFGGYRALKSALRELHGRGRWYVLAAELLFAGAFLAWAWVRANDPAANHTEQPMDLMFMNSLWTSPTLPADDAWLAGYPVSYYYLGYWLLTTLGQLSSTPPALAFNIGQASWFGLLLLSAFGLGFNLYSLAFGSGNAGAKADDGPEVSVSGAGLRGVVAGIVTALFVGVIGNLQVILEWFYAHGVNMDRLAAWLGVNGFPANAQQTGKWFIGTDWWWWRSSRVISDQDLMGNHIEVIDEFPMFSYILGDNHPHVLAMPIVILVIGMALSLFVGARRVSAESEGSRFARAWRLLVDSVPMGYAGLALVIVTSGALFFLNTWDYPPYWLLLTASLFVGTSVSQPRSSWRELGTPFLAAVLLGVALAVGPLGVYFPYFLTAQSQAGGFAPNLFNPSRLQQVLLMFGVFVPALIGLIYWFWCTYRPSLVTLGWWTLLTLGIPALFLAVSAAVVNAVGYTGNLQTPPENSASHLVYIIQRWTTRPFTFLLFGMGLALCLALLSTVLTQRKRQPHSRNTQLSIAPFVLLLAGIGMLLVYAPEFVFLRDNFGTRMNTVFKFYYQAWLLLAVAAAFMVSSLMNTKRLRVPLPAVVLGAVTAVLAIGAMLFPVAGVYSKTNGFASSNRTLSAIEYVAYENPAELAAVSWVMANTEPEALILEGKGASYRANYNRISSMTGRGTLLGWDGHESQWRGEQFGAMAAGRGELLEQIYRSARADEIPALLDAWDIDYVYIGPSERTQYEINDRSESRIADAMELVFEQGDVRIYQTP